MRKTLLTLLLVFAFALSACGGGATPAAETQPATVAAQPETAPEQTTAPETAPEQPQTSDTTPKTIIVALTQAPASLDPADHRDRAAETVIRNMFDGLVTRDNTSGVHLELATSIEWLDDTSMQIELKEGVKFHDGSVMTADDVVFTFERIIQENAIEYPEAHTSPRKGLIAPLETIEKTGDYTVVMNFNAPWPAAMQMLVHQQILPKAYLEEVGTQGFLEHPIGTGPFKFVSASDGLDQVVMERFDEYHGGAADLEPVGVACVDQAVFRTIPEASTRVAALLAGEVHIIQVVPLDMIENLQANPDIQVKTAPGTQPKWIELNVNQPPFDDVRVRQALNYLVDKELLIEEIYGGRAVALPGALSPYNNFVNKDLEPYPYDPDKAMALLAEAGWQDSDDDGFLDKDGQPLSFTIDTLESFRPLAEAVANLLQGAGIDANVRFWEYSVVKPKLQAGERMAYLDDWGDSAFDPVGHFEAKWHGFVENEPYGRGNFSGFDNARVNELVKLGEVSVDTAERQAHYDEAQQIVYDEAPAIFLLLPEEAEAAWVSVENWTPASDSRINLHDVCLTE
jgi:peptide/nickel transport system substrate-binding protein